MKKQYETPVVEKIAFVSEEEVCGVMSAFNDLFNVQVVSTGSSFSKNSVFDWSTMSE